MTNWRSQRLALLVLLASLCCPWGTRADEAAPPDQAAPPSADIQAGPRALSRAFREAARKATPSVVTVFAYGQNSQQPDEQATEEPSGPTPPPETDDRGALIPLSGLGSGVIISADGLVITNHHVIAGASRVVVQLSDQTELEVEQVHSDPDSDVATLRIAGEGPFDVAELGDSDSLEIGDWVLAIGSPFKLEATVSAGIISALNRAIPTIERGRLFQTDAAINPGNSGGPLIDLDGRVIGINTAIATRNGSYQGIGFAIPINQAKWIAEELATHGEVRRAAMGVRIAQLTPRLGKQLDLPTRLGVLVSQVIAGSAAEVAGIQSWDVILEFAGERVRDPADLQKIVERHPVGSTQPVKIYRDGEELMREVRLAPREDPTASEPSEAGEAPDGDSDPPAEADCSLEVD